MKTRSRTRSILASRIQRLKVRLRRPTPAYRPDFSDETFVTGLVSVSERLLEARRAMGAGDLGAARRYVVDHFVERTSPRFFCDIGVISELAHTLRRDRPQWVHGLLRRVSADRALGLRVVSRRGMPLNKGFEWKNIPPGPGGDDLYSAQPHRFGFMPGLALAAHHGESTLALIRVLLDRWFDAVAAGERECYHSPLAVLYRVLALSWTFVIVAGLADDEEQVRSGLLYRVLKLLFADTVYLAPTIGHSYPNNHLLADGFAGWFSGTLYPEFVCAAASRERGEAIFVRELCRQFYADGTNFEHSTHYHELGCEMALGYVLLSRRNSIELPPAVTDLLQRMLAFQAATTGPEAVPLPIGDSTEDPLFPLDVGHGWAAGALRECYRALFDADIAPAPMQDPTVERAYWLLGGALTAPPRLPSHEPMQRFEFGGFRVYRDALAAARLVFRSGPVEGLALSAGHAHADVLSVYLSVAGEPLIVNSGTYTYRYKSERWPATIPDWRSYFAGPRSHNGLMFGSDPYGPMVGDFRNRDVPCRVANRREINVPGLEWHEFEVTGDNVARGHRRGVVHVHAHYWFVYDLVPDAARAGGASIGLQFAERVWVDVRRGGVVDAVSGLAGCRIGFSPALVDVRCLNGSLRPLGGWVSPRYGELVAAPQLLANVAANSAPCGFVLRPVGVDGSDCSIPEAVADGAWHAFRLHEGDADDLLLVRVADDGRQIAMWNVEFDGDLLWMRIRSGTVVDVRSVGGSCLVYAGQQLALPVR